MEGAAVGTCVLSAASAAREKASLMASSPTLYITVSSTNLLARTSLVTSTLGKNALWWMQDGTSNTDIISMFVCVCIYIYTYGVWINISLQEKLLRSYVYEISETIPLVAHVFYFNGVVSRGEHISKLLHLKTNIGFQDPCCTGVCESYGWIQKAPTMVLFLKTLHCIGCRRAF